MITFKQLQEKLSDKEYKEVDALLNRDTLLRGKLMNPTQRQKFASMSGRETFRRLKRNENGKLRIDRGTEKKIKVNTHTVSKNFPKLSEGAMAIPVAAGIASKVLPAAAATIGAVGTMMQIKKRVPKDKSKTADIAREKGLDLTNPRQRRKAASLANKRNKTNKTNKKINPKTGDVVKPRYDTKFKGIRVDAKKGEAEATEKLIDKINNPSYLEKIRRNIRKEEAMAAPTNSMGGGAIAGSVEAGDNPPVKKKKRYIYGGAGSRKMWMNNK